jgi:hypothetical protein
VNWKRAFCAVAGGLSLGLTTAAAGDPPDRQGVSLAAYQPAQPMPPATPPPPAEGFASAPESAPAPAETYPPNMYGDFIGPFSTRFIVVRSTLQVNNQPLGTTADVLAAREPDLASGAYKIAENESPRPQDRFFVNVN